VSDRFVHGVQPVLEALRSPERVKRVLLARRPGGSTRRLEEAAREAGVSLEVVPRADLDRVAGGARRHQGVAAELREGDLELLSLGELLDRLEDVASPLVLLLDGIQDPGNLGAIIRSAYALGADGIIVPQDRSARIGPAAVKSSAGAALHLPIAQVVNLKHALDPLGELGLWTAAAVLDGDPVHRVDLARPLALVVGGEGKGVRPSLARRCEIRLRVPMTRPFDSLNASVAAGVLLYEVARQRFARGSS
jgi:23S rRNA (guanosine2251-2'-O)-methyltransferase